MSLMMTLGHYAACTLVCSPRLAAIADMHSKVFLRLGKRNEQHPMTVQK